MRTGMRWQWERRRLKQDGSFFVKAPADRAIRFVLLDAKGAVLRQEHGWFWIRRGEQRICVGCHAGPEHAAENRVPAVLLRTTTPVDLTGIGADTCHGEATEMSYRTFLFLLSTASIALAQTTGMPPAASAVRWFANEPWREVDDSL